MTNVLLTCVGRRNYLVDFFRQALGSRGQVYGADANRHACALQECDKAFVIPPIHSVGYCDDLLSLCHEHDVRLLVPLLDLELPLLARARERFLSIGTIPVISPPEVVDSCFDKWATIGLLSTCGLSHPQTYVNLGDARAAIQNRQIRYPLVVKPRWGSASIGIDYADDDEELEMAVRLLKRRLTRSILAPASMNDLERSVLIQERLEGQEYGLDVVNDLNGRYVTTFVRRKLGMRAGETDQAVTVECKRLAAMGEIIGQKVGHRGNLDCDVFVTEQGCCVLEMNPRFGGGYPFSHVGGANLPAMLIAWASGTAVDPRWTRIAPNVVASKCDRLVTTHA
jgi:carbamoyl-phosphate synthase large subunit